MSLQACVTGAAARRDSDRAGFGFADCAAPSHPCERQDSAECGPGNHRNLTGAQAAQEFGDAGRSPAVIRPGVTAQRCSPAAGQSHFRFRREFAVCKRTMPCSSSPATATSVPGLGSPLPPLHWDCACPLRVRLPFVAAPHLALRPVVPSPDRAIISDQPAERNPRRSSCSLCSTRLVRDEDANSGTTGAIFAYAAVVAVSILAVYLSRPK